MKKNKLIIIVVLLLSATALYFFISYSNGTIKRELRDFAVKDTTSINKIFIADRKGNKSLLERKPGRAGWTVNGKYDARPDAIKTLLGTIRAIEVRSPVAKAGYNTVLKMLASDGTKIEIYSDNELIKTYYVGGPTEDFLGTFMYLENSTVPFVIHIPGFDGYLSTRYFAKEGEWRSPIIFGYGENQIARVIAKDFLDSSKSFKVEKQGNEYKFYTPFNNAQPSQVYQSQIAAYLAKYQLIAYEWVAADMKKHVKDSILQSPPLRYLEVTDVNGKTTRMTMYRKPVAEGTLSSTDPTTGELRAYDYDRLYSTLNNDTNLLGIQYFVFDKLFKKPNEIKGFGS